MKFKIELTEDMLKTISAAIGELPTRVGLPIVNELNRQLAEQMKPTPVKEDKAA